MGTRGAGAERRKILRAGVRSHNRFYRALAEEARAFNAARATGAVLALLQRSLGEKTLRDVARVTPVFEVNLGARRPDCVCVFEFARGDGDGAAAEAVCVILELKTCKFTFAPDSASKREQRATGLAQLRDSLRLLLAAMPPGSDTILVCPVLLFVSQRTLRATRVTRLAPRRASGNATNLVRALRAVAAYTPPPQKPGPRKGARKTAVGARGRGTAAPAPAPAAAKPDPAPRLRPPPFPHELVAAPRRAGSAPGVLQRIAALFCIPPPAGGRDAAGPADPAGEPREATRRVAGG
ncbi:nuclear protein UL24 [Ateline alphaherpesvirus 1]|uniref:Nuclear protein UL24 n=1 Tax=Herpesvirus ateles type 1 (strain Lennette) TaxID=35243 RepID=A0A1S6JLP1_HSVA1|nr:nuclear protein UL24 [Ateline alphaherpesvirus 1]AQS79192.1 nuclear protein UL24 [Ateline alphaherpesvirus 1]